MLQDVAGIQRSPLAGNVGLRDGARGFGRVMCRGRKKARPRGATLIPGVKPMCRFAGLHVCCLAELEEVLRFAVQGYGFFSSSIYCLISLLQVIEGTEFGVGGLSSATPQP